MGLPVTSLYNLPWLSANSYPNGKAFQRNGGLWAELATSLAFSTFVDDQPDIVTSASTASLSMYGGNVVSVSAALLDPASGNPVRGIRMPNWAMGSDGQQGFNGDDMTVNERIDDCPSCYNSNRWLTVMFSSHSNTSDPLYGESGASALVTDQFALTFNRTLTATTDADGRYSFSELPGSAYSIRCNKPGYYGSVAGSLATGEQKNLDMQLISIPLLSVSITSPLDGATYNYARSVTVTGNVSNNASVTVNGVAAAVSNGVYTASVYIADGATMITANATDQYGQAATTSITVTVPLPPQISSISTSGITTDSAVIRWVTDQPATSAVAYGESSSYDKSVFANTPATNHEINISALKPSTTYHFMVVSTNAYGRTSSSADLVLTTPRFSAKSIGDIGNVAVVEVSGDYNADAPDCLVYTPPRQEIAKEYIRTHGDNYDFLVFLTNFDYAMRESNVKGFYIEAKNDTAGIGNVLFDRSAEFGSLGKLQGTIDMGNVLPLAANPYGPRLDQMITTLSHELMHRWGAHAVFKDPDGSANFGLLGQDNTHWSYLLDTKGSIMYGNGWRNNKDGTFTSTSIMSGYSPLDLYLMGMIDKSRVPPMLLIDNPAIDKTKLPELGATISGTAKTVTIEDIVAALGERIPNAATSPKKFNIGFVLLTRPGASAGNAPAAIETIRSAWAGRFAELTQGISGINGVAPSLNLNIDTPADNATNTGPDVTVTGTVINSTGAETGIMVNGIPATITGSRFIANRVPLQEGSNTISITATDANGLTATATRNVTAQAGHYLRITTNIDSGTGPLDVSFRINGSFSSTSYVRSATGPVPVSIIPGQSPEEFSARLSAEGNYTFTASATGPDGQMCSDSVTVTVISKAQLEMLLQGKWEGLNAKLMSKDLEGALSYLISPIQNDYRTELSRYLDKLPLLAQNMPDIELVYSSENRAKTRLFREETIKGQKMVIGYPVYYIRENGIWKLLNF